jgi:hypothetical protein
MWRLPILIVFIVVAFNGAADAKPHPQRTACQRLNAHHRDLSPHRRLVLVSRGDSEVGNISTCVLPRGKVRRLAAWDDGLGRASVDVVGTKGYFVLIDDAWSDQYGGTSRTLLRVNARTRRRATLASYGCQVDFGHPACSDGTAYGKVVLAPSGAGALELTHLDTGVRTLESFDPAGTSAVLDEGPVDTLSIDGDEIVWTRAGTERRAPLPG